MSLVDSEVPAVPRGRIVLSGEAEGWGLEDRKSSGRHTQ